MANTRCYSQEFKDEAVRLVIENGYSISEAASQVSIPNSTLSQWVNKVKKPDIVGVESLPDLPYTADENKRLRKEVLRLQDDNEILKKSDSVLCKREPVKFAWINTHRTKYSVVIMCKVLKVSRSGYYKFLTRKPSATEEKRKVITFHAKVFHKRSKAIYGYRKVYEDFKAELPELPCSSETVRKVMY